LKIKILEQIPSLLFWGCGSGCFICKVGWRGENKMKNIKKKRKEEEEKHATSTQ
jgi:hypothetical protein